MSSSIYEASSYAAGPEVEYRNISSLSEVVLFLVSVVLGRCVSVVVGAGVVVGDEVSAHFLSLRDYAVVDVVGVHLTPVKHSARVMWK